MRAWRLPRVTMLIQYLYRDEPALSRFQTGLVFVDDRWKPSLQAFRLPFAQMGRHGLQAIVWGQIRDGRPDGGRIGWKCCGGTHGSRSGAPG